MKDYQQVRKDSLQNLTELRKGLPDVMEAFSGVGAATYKDGALNAKTKEMIALAIAVSGRCDGCIAFHARSACKKGATREEILDTIAVAIQMGGGPSMVYGADALHAYDQFCEKK